MHGTKALQYMGEACRSRCPSGLNSLYIGLKIDKNNSQIPHGTVNSYNHTYPQSGESGDSVTLLDRSERGSHEDKDDKLMAIMEAERHTVTQ